MSFDILDPVTLKCVFSAGLAEWKALLTVARESGWEPLGTARPPPVPNPTTEADWATEWSGDYTFGVMTKEDALAFADALERALPRIPPDFPFPYSSLDGDMVAHTVELCRTHRGLFVIALPDPPGTMTLLDPRTCEPVHRDTPVCVDCPWSRNWRALLEVAGEHGWRSTRTMPPPPGWEGSRKERSALTWKGLQKKPFARPAWRGDYFYGVISEVDAMAFADALERALPKVRERARQQDRTADTPYNQLTRASVQHLIDVCRRERGLFLMG